jgi:hypothetical protein
MRLPELPVNPPLHLQDNSEPDYEAETTDSILDHVEAIRELAEEILDGIDERPETRERLEELKARSTKFFQWMGDDHRYRELFEDEVG